MIPLGESRVELLEPLGPETTVGRFLSKRGAGLHHVALHVDDIHAAWAQLQARGATLVSPGHPDRSRRSPVLLRTPEEHGRCPARNLPGPGVMFEHPVLAFDTCGEVGTVALVDLENGATTVTCISQTELGGRTASAQLLPALDEMLRKAALDLRALRAIVVVNGPGSFTGTRVGLSTAKGLAHAAGVPDRRNLPSRGACRSG